MIWSEYDTVLKLTQVVKSHNHKLMVLRVEKFNPMMVSRRWTHWEAPGSLGGCPWKSFHTRVACRLSQAQCFLSILAPHEIIFLYSLSCCRPLGLIS